MTEFGQNSFKADAWTLDYFANHGQKITMAIDRVHSGFIRISEANAFASTIPNGWSFHASSKWASLSFPFIIWMAFPNLNFAPLVLFNNNSYLLSNINLCYPIFEPLACEPRRQQLPATTIELRNLVQNKVHAQDAALRAQLDKSCGILKMNLCFGWYMETCLWKKWEHLCLKLCIFFASGIDTSVPVVHSSALYSHVGLIFGPSRDIVQAHFRSKGMGSPPWSPTHDQKGRPCKGHKPF